ncbi:type II secretion system GspH family protein [bacterium]|nr:type II secretion system protein [Candidatus Omnitrophota bacterium]MBU2528596.1 type II secretion system GspH family protein [bacterium]MBU3930524.1 type II secretion system GspH family protein [bacterium]MBU4123599.1 type II secretion system GspH family protein [bacterium]
MKQTKKGFTLIELMIVVAIIGVLAAVAIPKFADLIRKANEAACKGQLGAVRSAMSIYYGNTEGVWPLTANGMCPTYLQAIPDCKSGVAGITTTNDCETETDGNNDITTIASYDGGWWYNCGTTNPGGTFTGVFLVNVTATDTKGTAIHTW